MDPLYTAERASRKRVWDGLVRMDEEARRNPPHRAWGPKGIRQPMAIIKVEPVEKTTKSDLELCYLPDEYHREWLCSFCWTSMDDHTWSSFDTKQDGKLVPRWTPSYCTLYKLLDRIAHDFFSGREVSLDTRASLLIDETRLAFRELDRVSAVMATTSISLRKPDSVITTSVISEFERTDPKKRSFQAMTIIQQLEALKGWLETCTNTLADDREDIHNECQKEHIDNSIPAIRVLDLTDAPRGTVRIVETKDRKGRYVALSHCWGDSKRHPLMTTHATLEAHMAGIPFMKLPQSFRDAIIVCLFLEIQFIWIDCLCIVQDDYAEWLAEAEKMAEIYQDSYLTVAATRAQNSQHGFLFDLPNDTAHYRVMVEAPWEQEVTENRTFQAMFKVDHDISKSDSTPLNRRAWCLQEWYLPNRLVEFCLDDIRFLCLRRVETRFGRTNDKQTWTRTIARGFGINKEDFFRTLWENARDDFFGRDITRASDRLPALAGFAQMLETRLFGVVGQRYLAGLWSTRLSEDLTWTVLEFDHETHSIEGVPSWSWAGTNAPCTYMYGKPSKTYVELVEAHCTGYARPRETPASLKIKGFVASLFLKVDHRLAGYDGRPHLSFWVDEDAALAAQPEAKERSPGSMTTSLFVSDMPIFAGVHDHAIAEAHDNTQLCKVFSILRASSSHTLSTECPSLGFVSPVKLLLLARSDVSISVLVLSPVASQSRKGKERFVPARDGQYQRLGLIEVDCCRQAPVMETEDGFVVPVDTFWEVDNEEARVVVTLV